MKRWWHFNGQEVSTHTWGRSQTSMAFYFQSSLLPWKQVRFLSISEKSGALDPQFDILASSFSQDWYMTPRTRTTLECLDQSQLGHLLNFTSGLSNHRAQPCNLFRSWAWNAEWSASHLRAITTVLCSQPQTGKRYIPFNSKSELQAPSEWTSFGQQALLKDFRRCQPIWSLEKLHVYRGLKTLS